MKIKPKAVFLTQKTAFRKMSKQFLQKIGFSDTKNCLKFFSREKKAKK